MYEEEENRRKSENISPFQPLQSQPRIETIPFVPVEEKWKKKMKIIIEKERKYTSSLEKKEPISISSTDINIPFSSQSISNKFDTNIENNENSLPEINENYVLSQKSDLETLKELEWMLEHSESDEEVNNEQEVDVKQECEDIMTSANQDDNDPSQPLDYPEEKIENSDQREDEIINFSQDYNVFSSQESEITKKRYFKYFEDPPKHDSFQTSNSTEFSQEVNDELNQICSFNGVSFTKKKRYFTPKEPPPSFNSFFLNKPNSLSSSVESPNKRTILKTQIETSSFPNQKNQYKFNLSSEDNSHKEDSFNQHFTIFSFEIFSPTFTKKLPNPKISPIVAIFYTILNEDIREIKGKEYINHTGFVFSFSNLIFFFSNKLNKKFFRNNLFG